MLLDVSLGSELYSERIADSGLVGDGAISNLPSIITNTFGDIAIFISLYYVSLKKIKNVYNRSDDKYFGNLDSAYFARIKRSYGFKIYLYYYCVYYSL